MSQPPQPHQPLRPPYLCPRCGYNTPKKPHMRYHFYATKKPCQGIVRLIELTEEIKQTILDHRVYHPPQPAAKKRKNPISKALRKVVWNTHVQCDLKTVKCFCCETTLISTFDFECGHILAESKGGPTNVHNLLPVCSVCNNSMYNENFHDFKARNFGTISIAESLL